MKKSMLALITIGCLLPLTSSPICLRYVSGPFYNNELEVVIDWTKVGSLLPSVSEQNKLYKGGKRIRYFSGGDTLYITLRGRKKNDDDVVLTTQKLVGNASYDITIDDNDHVTFTETIDRKCEKSN